MQLHHGVSRRQWRVAGAGTAHAEFEERTGGGIGGKRWLAPLMPADFAAPVHYGWPEYVTTARGEGWYVPEGA